MNSTYSPDIARHRLGWASRITGRDLVLPIGSVAAAASAAMTLTGATPAPLIVVTFVLCTLAAGQRMSWLASVATTVLGMLAGLAVAMRVYPYLGLPLEPSNTLTLLAVSATALVSLGRRRSRLRLPTRTGVALLASALVVPLTALATMATIIIRSGGSKISWAMNNDATFSLMIARFMVDDGGDDPEKHLTLAPLTYEVLAAFISPGRSSVDPSDLLSHDVDRVIQVLLLMLVAMSVLGAVAVAHVVPRDRVVSRIVLCLLMGLVPWTWFVAGFAWKYGFHNALLTGVIVTVVWIAWIESRTHPVLGTALQAMAATALLATWAPLVLVPAGLGGLLLARSWREHLSLRGLKLVGWLIPILAFAWYALFATLPVFRESSSTLGADGAMFASHPADAAMAFGIALAVAILCTTSRQTQWQVVGVTTIGAVGTLGALYLVSQRVDMPVGRWGYYPAKYAWLLAMFAPIVCARAVAGRLTERSLPWARRGGLVAACVLVVGAVMGQFQPPDLRSPSTDYPQPRTTPDWTIASLFPIVSVAAEGGMSDMDPAAEELLRISDPTRKIFVMRYSSDPTEDTFINYWLLWQQFDAFPLINGVRGYDLVAENDPLGAACAIVDDWQGGVEVLTRDASLPRKVRARCPQAEVAFTVAPRERS